MCIKAVDAMLAAPLSPPGLKLTGVALAHMLNAKTRLCNPSIATIADRVGVSPSQAQRYVRDLKTLGILSVVGNALGGKPGTTPHYRLHLDQLAALSKTDSTHAAPTGSIGDTPTGRADAAPANTDRGSMDAAEGQHPCGRGAAPMRQTGSTHAAQTGINRKEPEENLGGGHVGLQLDAFEAGSPANAGQLPSPSAKSVRTGKPKPPTDGVWKAYASAYLARHGIEPVRNAKTNGQLMGLVKQLGDEEAAKLAAYYVGSANPYYVQRAHPISALVADVDRLRVEMIRGPLQPWAAGSTQPDLAELTARVQRRLGHTPGAVIQAEDFASKDYSAGAPEVHHHV